MPPRKRKDPEPTGEWSLLLEGKWSPYTADDNLEIEKAWEASQAKGAAKSVVITKLSFAKGAAYEFDFDEMTQKNLSTKRSRKIQRTAAATTASTTDGSAATTTTGGAMKLSRSTASATALPAAKAAKAVKAPAASPVKMSKGISLELGVLGHICISSPARI